MSSRDQALTTSAELFKALGHPARLLIVNLVRMRPRHGEELAVLLNLNPATISHHLALLASAGLLQSHKDQYYQVYSLAPGALERTLSELVQPAPNQAQPLEGEDAYRSKVLRTFLQRGRLVSIPAQQKKRQIVLEKLVEEFEPGRAYSEQEVNQALVVFHDDVASLRRGMIEFGLMERSQGVYRRS